MGSPLSTDNFFILLILLHSTFFQSSMPNFANRTSKIAILDYVESSQSLDRIHATYLAEIASVLLIYAPFHPMTDLLAKLNNESIRMLIQTTKQLKIDQNMHIQRK